MFTLTAEECELLTYVQGLADKKGRIRSDFTDPKQFAAAVLLTKKAFETHRYPGKLEQLERIRQDHEANGPTPIDAPADGGWQDTFLVTDLGWASLQPKIPAANGLATVVGGYTNMNLTLIIQDVDTHKFLVGTSSQEPLGNFMTIRTKQAKSTTATELIATLMYSYDKGGSSYSNFATRILENQMAQADPVITAPVRTTLNPLNPHAINIGLGRPWNDQGGSSGLDYAWNEPVQDHPVGKIPFVGSVIFPQNILSPLSDYMYLDIYVCNMDTGGGANLVPNSDIIGQFSIDSGNPQKLNWSFPPGQSTTDPGNPITFSNITWPSDVATCFYCAMFVGLANNIMGKAVVTSEKDADADPLDGVLNIPDINFVWHCLGEDSSILMADGTTKPIAQVIAGDLVRTDDIGATGIVEWTNKGAHFGSLIRIATDNGNEITATDNHVFISTAGPKTADELKKGDCLRTAGGDTRIKEATTLKNSTGLLYNLAIRPNGSSSSAGKTPIATFIANSYLVGDVKAQKSLRHSRYNDIDWVKSRVPAYMHKDVESWFEDKAVNQPITTP